MSPKIVPAAFLRGCTALLVFTAAIAGCDRSDPAPSEPDAQAALEYPDTERGETVDDYFGTKVADPYRWLEDEARESAAVTDWVDAQNAVTFSYLDQLKDRYRIKDRLTQLWDYEKYQIPIRKGGRLFYRHNDGLQNQYVLYVVEGEGGQPRALIDPNSWSADGATALGGYSPSPDGGLVAYSIQDGGSDWRTVKVLDVESGQTLEDELTWVKFSGLSWAPDGSGFYYSRYPEPDPTATFQAPNFNQTLMFHALGTAQAEDRLIYARDDDPAVSVRGYVFADRYLAVMMSRGTDARYDVAIQDLSDPEAGPEILIEGFEHSYQFVGADGRVIFAVTDRDAPNRRIVAINLDAPEVENWQEIVPEAEHVLNGASIVGGFLLASYLEDVKSVVRRFELDGTELEPVPLPGIGTAFGFMGEADEPDTFFSFSSYNSPPTLFALNARTNETTVFRRSDVPFDAADYVVEQVFFESKDGTRVPMFIARRKDLELDGGVPTLLYGYGGFSISTMPAFSLTAFAWMEMGGIYAVANLRGGGEYGRDWHDAGRLANKQNVFDDFIAAAEFLIDNGFTTPEQLGISGRSNGGLLVGAVTNQRPDLFAAALPAVGVMDMLRFDQFTAGRFWRDDYGSPSENEADFENNLAFSPYHNIRPGVDYPAVLVTTADTDDRVVPGHSFKYAAALQAAPTGTEPTLIRIETRAGHGSGKPTEKIIEEFADQWAFLAEHTGLELEEGYGER